MLYFVEGAGGNRDFDDNLSNPRGGGVSIDQDDATSGFVSQTIGSTMYQFAKGVGSFLDTSLTDDAMKVFLGNPGSGHKITARFKSKLFSFAHITVDNNVLTLYQISEPLGATTSATASNPAPFGTDYLGRPVNDPLPDTVFDPVTRTVISSAGAGVPALLDKVTVTKPDISNLARLKFTAPAAAGRGTEMDLNFLYKNDSGFALNGTQLIITLPAGVSFESASDGSVTVQGRHVVITLGRTLPGQTITLHVKATVSNSVRPGSTLTTSALLRSSTALPVIAENHTTKVMPAP